MLQTLEFRSDRHDSKQDTCQGVIVARLILKKTVKTTDERMNTDIKCCSPAESFFQEESVFICVHPWFTKPDSDDGSAAGCGSQGIQLTVHSTERRAPLGS
jgi:hypothetical protein